MRIFMFLIYIYMKTLKISMSHDSMSGVTHLTFTGVTHKPAGMDRFIIASKA
jgi:hypothetical protein